MTAAVTPKANINEMTNERWLAFAPEGEIRVATSPAVRFDDHWFVCVGAGATREQAIKDSWPYAHVRLYENVFWEFVPKLDVGSDGTGWVEQPG